MSVTVYSGVPGSGKSLHAAELLYWKLRTHQTVIANFDINRDIPKLDYSCFHFVPNRELTPRFLVDFSNDFFGDRPRKENQICVFIDECALPSLLSNRTWNRPDRPEWITLFQQHRKLGFGPFVLITQDINCIDKAVRAVITHEVNFRKVNDIKGLGSFINLLLLGRPLIVGVKYYLPIKVHSKKSARTGSEWTLGRKRYFQLYDTFTIFQD